MFSSCPALILLFKIFPRSRMLFFYGAMLMQEVLAGLLAAVVSIANDRCSAAIISNMCRTSRNS
jgi:hypothetical protein